jgi:hypothetical protein
LFTLSAGLLVVNEVADKGTEDVNVCGGGAYIEFKNIGTDPINVGSYGLQVFDETTNPSRGLILGFTSLTRVSDNFILAPNSPSTLAVGSLLVLCTKFRIADRTRFKITFTASLTFVSESTLILTGTSKAQSLQRPLDGSGVFLLATPTPFQPNVFQRPVISVQGDPHFMTWRGQHYDFMGECDLVFIQSKDFESGLDLDIHIRTKMRRDMSFVSSAVLRIGSDILEVASQGLYFLNGVANAELPSEFSGFEFLHSQPTDKQHVFEVHLGGRERIKVKTYKDFLRSWLSRARVSTF